MCNLSESDGSFFGALELTLRWGEVATCAQLEFMLDAERQHAARVVIQTGGRLLERALRQAKHSVRRRFEVWRVLTRHQLLMHRTSCAVRAICCSWGSWQLSTAESCFAARDKESRGWLHKLRTGFNLVITRHHSPSYVGRAAPLVCCR